MNQRMPTRSLADPDFEMVDLFGNGLPDIVQMNGGALYWRHQGGGIFDAPELMAEVPAGVQLRDPGVRFGDLNGDGRADLLVTKLGGYFPLSFEGRWSKQGFVRFHHVPSVDVLGSSDARLMDLDGDGVVDALQTGPQFELFFNDPNLGWSRVETIPRGPIEQFPDLNFSNARMKLADLSGDGLQDFVLVNQGRIDYWPYLGFGRWGPRVSMDKSPVFTDTVLPPGQFDPRRVLLGDVDGDGLDDLVYLEPRRITVWINQSGNRWSDPIFINATPSFTDVDAVRLADMLGTGVLGILWTIDETVPGARTYTFLDLTGGEKPYALDSMDNHRGATTRIKYAPSTKFYRDDFANSDTRWKTPLPFPVQVVERVEVIDELSGGKLTTQFRYHHGYWDGSEREFRGFGMVERLDTETFGQFNAPGLHGQGTDFNQVSEEHFSPPTLTRTWFHLGPIGDEFGDRSEADFSREYAPTDPPVLKRPGDTTTLLRNLLRQPRADAMRSLRGANLRTELSALDGTDRETRPYTVTEFQYGIREESEPADTEGERKRIFFPHLVAQRTSQWERDDEPLTQFTFTDDYDQYGQARSHISIAVPRGRDFRVAVASSDPYLATHTVTSYAQRDDAQHYLVDRVARMTTYEVHNDGKSILFDLKEAISNGSSSQSIFGQTLSFYDGPPFQGLAFGQIGNYGTLVRTEQLVLTREILHEAYKSGDTVQTPPEEPPYLTPDGTPVWTADYPQEFRTLLPGLAGHTYQPGDTGSEYAPGYFSATERRRYDFQDDPSGKGRGLIAAKRDPFGRDTTMAYDTFDLLPTEVTDPAGLQRKVSYDYRVLQPHEVTDPNGNLTVFTYTPLGLLENTAFLDKNGEGDTPDKPSIRFEYNFLAFVSRGQPISVRTIRRVHHVNEQDVSLIERDETIETVEYSDGFGRLLQTRTQAEDIIFGDPIFGDAGLVADQSLAVEDAIVRQRSASDPPRVVVSGWQVYDNKSQVIEKYEPFFSDGWDYATPLDTQRGQKVTMYYDPRGQVIRTVNPDSSEQRVIYGVPADLTKPEQFTPTPWETYTYDANDNAGRTIQTVERNGSDPAKDWFTTRSTYDIRGNLLTVTDPLGRLAFNYVYDLANKPLRLENIDAGILRCILDAAGNIIEQRDSKGTLILRAYDILNRPICLWAQVRTGESLTLREHLLYGDSPGTGLSADQAAAHNVLGKLYEHYDEAGRLTFEAYDFKGNVIEKVREVISDNAILTVFNPAPPNWQVQAFRVNWQPPDGTSLESYAGQLLDPRTYDTTFTYDALNRIKTTHYPQDVEGTSKVLRPRYNRAGALEHVEFDGTTYVEHIAYNAKGQRTLIAYGNQIMTRHAYDPKTFRLTRLRTEHFTAPMELTYHPAGAVLQDFAYEYDVIGNILSIQDRTPESGILNNPEAVHLADPQLAQLLVSGNALIRHFETDPLGRTFTKIRKACRQVPRSDKRVPIYKMLMEEAASGAAWPRRRTPIPILHVKIPPFSAKSVHLSVNLPPEKSIRSMTCLPSGRRAK